MDFNPERGAQSKFDEVLAERYHLSGSRKIREIYNRYRLTVLLEKMEEALKPGELSGP